MSELMDEIKALRKELHQLTLLVMKDKVDTTWLSEEDAAQSLGFTPNVLRRKVKAGELDITSRNTNGRKWQYSRKSILSYKQNTSFN